MAFEKVLHPKTRRLMCRVDVARQLVEVKDGGETAVVDLTALPDSANVKIGIVPESARFITKNDAEGRILAVEAVVFDVGAVEVS